ncbi:MAG: nuclear transport factor 2 family protein [Solirubrobacterales bacterium]
MTEAEFNAHARKMLDAWNRQDVEAVLARYTSDGSYLDPNTGGPVVGREALRRYLTRLFEAWEMHWEEREHFLFGEADGAAVLWRATLRPRGGGAEVTVEGMDLILMEGELVARNEVHFDRARLAALLAPAAQAG